MSRNPVQRVSYAIGVTLGALTLLAIIAILLGALVWLARLVWAGALG